FFLGSPVSIMMQGFFVVYDLMNVAVSKNINKPTINKLIYAHPCLLGGLSWRICGVRDMLDFPDLA
ncbi:MAG: hypothetical protein J6C87_04345, partial [Bacteroides sp.]|nr:hypothetical protein [Bacteroides sp.]